MALPRFTTSLVVALLLVQLAGPALHALDHHEHGHPHAHADEPQPSHHDSERCDVCQFVASQAADLPGLNQLPAFAPRAESAIVRAAEVPDSACLGSSLARAPPARI